MVSTFNKFVLLLLLVVFVVSCGSLVEDNGTRSSAIRAGYPTAEFTACGERFVGLGVCVVKPDQDISTVNLKIQGYASGNVRIVSSGCYQEVDISRGYGQHELINVPLVGEPTRDCLVTFTVSPKFKGQDNSGIIIEPIEGHLYIRRFSKDYTKKVSRTRRNQTMSFPGVGLNRVVMKSSHCSLDFDEDIEAENGKVFLRLDDLLELDREQLCIMNGGNITTSRLLVWYAAIYDIDYNKLPTPRVTFKKKKIKVEADSNVSVINLNGEYAYRRKKTFKFNPDVKNILRIMTVKGRTRVGIWDPSKREFLWD